MLNISRLEKLEKLRNIMSQHDVDAYIISSSDPHMSEYTPDKYKRREFMTDFFGSQGTCLVTKSSAHLIVDGRYIVEAKKTATPEYQVHLLKGGFYADIVDILKEENFCGALGVDVEVTSWMSFKALTNYIEYSGLNVNTNFRIKLLDLNLVDIIRPQEEIKPTRTDIFIHEVEYAGESSKSKVNKVLLEMKKQNARILFLSSLTQISWLLNLRGSDVHCTPVFLGYLIVEILDKIDQIETKEISFRLKVFVNIECIKSCEEMLKNEFQDQISIIQIENIMEELHHSFSELNSNQTSKLNKIWLPENFCNLATMDTLLKVFNPQENYDSSNYYKYLIDYFNSSKLLITSESPIIMLRAIKNEIELKGMRDCHIYDGLALTKFLYYLYKSGREGTLFDGKVSEWDLSQKLLEFRKQQPKFVYPSFDTISSIGENGAVIHYRPEKENSSIIKPDLYLCDSGGQYYTGTTDVTRTLFLFGNGEERPTIEQIETFTRVLIGFIRLHKLVFPVGTNAVAIDVLARASLWEAGLDYLHGTGHGVGSFLSVHEEPWSICYKVGRGGVYNQNLAAGAVVSIEPGYYEEGKYGIRIENLAEIVEADINNGYKKMNRFLKFSPLTFAPIQREMIDISILSDEELDWLNWYHLKTLENLEPLVDDDPEFLKWLVQVCSPINRDISKVNFPRTLYQ
ncbi:Xaa-Pro aminopeptidase 1 [Cryptosporidium sp. chipmunk genotype I]|uniref:Xaa-Pro aminopeptidase 1 n=1 Tax=Cryptosporidium sp. chipmunk genotype I TaxID=1280935 RepID=UPI00351A2629|nr:Xaa-Pro aminopeptidase 1 [Cryptosporidium sp. chipmunk genotype I]